MRGSRGGARTWVCSGSSGIYTREPWRASKDSSERTLRVSGCSDLELLGVKARPAVATFGADGSVVPYPFIQLQYHMGGYQIMVPFRVP